jgi:hypothetical protein
MPLGWPDRLTVNSVQTEGIGGPVMLMVTLRTNHEPWYIPLNELKVLADREKEVRRKAAAASNPLATLTLTLTLTRTQRGSD